MTPAKYDRPAGNQPTAINPLRDCSEPRQAGASERWLAISPHAASHYRQRAFGCSRWAWPPHRLGRAVYVSAWVDRCSHSASVRLSIVRLTDPSANSGYARCRPVSGAATASPFIVPYSPSVRPVYGPCAILPHPQVQRLGKDQVRQLAGLTGGAFSTRLTPGHRTIERTGLTRQRSRRPRVPQGDAPACPIDDPLTDTDRRARRT